MDQQLSKSILLVFFGLLEDYSGTRMFDLQARGLGQRLGVLLLYLECRSLDI